MKLNEYTVLSIKGLECTVCLCHCTDVGTETFLTTNNLCVIFNINFFIKLTDYHVIQRRILWHLTRLCAQVFNSFLSA